MSLVEEIRALKKSRGQDDRGVFLNDNLVSPCKHPRFRTLTHSTQSGFDAFMDFTSPSNENMDVLENFDFDRFLHQDVESGRSFNFDKGFNIDNNGINIE